MKNLTKSKTPIFDNNGVEIAFVISNAGNGLKYAKAIAWLKSIAVELSTHSPLKDVQNVNWYKRLKKVFFKGGVEAVQEYLLCIMLKISEVKEHVTDFNGTKVIEMKPTLRNDAYEYFTSLIMLTRYKALPARQA